MIARALALALLYACTGPAAGLIRARDLRDDLGPLKRVAGPHPGVEHRARPGGRPAAGGPVLVGPDHDWIRTTKAKVRPG